MTKIRPWLAATLTAASLAIGSAPTAQAQDKPRDEGLDKLLEKLDESKADPAKDKADDPAKGDAPGKLAPKDEGLDKLLKGLGETKDAPAPDDKKPGGAGGAEGPTPPPPDGARPDALKGAEKKLDKELDRILGKKEKPKDGPDKEKKEGEGSGPLGDVIKEMRDVEERLGKPDTGEETRKKQTEIVKNLDTLIEQLKNAPSQSQGMKMIRQGKKPGQQPGQPDQQPGAMADGAPETRPLKPKQPPPPIEIAKALWGQLPPQFRDDMANVLNENPLPSKVDLIRLYYLSLGKKSSTREP